jgi:COP9 signalosome complex subunit 2
VQGIIRECGGKMHMHDQNWPEAATDFFEVSGGGGGGCSCLQVLVDACRALGPLHPHFTASKCSSPPKHNHESKSPGVMSPQHWHRVVLGYQTAWLYLLASFCRSSAGH